MLLSKRAMEMINQIEQLEIEQASLKQTKERLEKQVEKMIADNELKAEELDIVVNAITILREVSDEAVKQSYEFIQDSLNAALERIFKDSVRRIRLKEYTLRGQYPQLEIELRVENGKVRSLKTGSGHGLMQIISLLCVLSLIVITNSRRLLVIDEVLSGLSARARRIIADILWTFTTIGFQFIISEHGFVPKGARVYHLRMKDGVSSVVADYIEPEGIYLDGVDLLTGDRIVDTVEDEYEDYNGMDDVINVGKADTL